MLVIFHFGSVTENTYQKIDIYGYDYQHFSNVNDRKI